MSNFGQTLFGASPLIRWTIGPCIALFLITMTVIVPDWNVRTVSMIVAFYVLGVPMILGLFIPRLGRIVFRIVTGLVFVGYLLYLFMELRDHNWHFVRPRSRGDANPVNALFGLLVIGLPCLIYTVLGRFTLRREEVHATDDLDDTDEDEDSEQSGGGYGSPGAGSPSPHR